MPIQITKKLRRILITIAISVVALVALVIIFISPITKYLVEKYSVEYTGRQIRMDWAYVNPFTGYVHFHNLKVQELNSDSIFFSSKGFTVNFAVWKLFSKEYIIEEFKLNKPYGVIAENKSVFNFDDIIDRFSSKAIGKKGPPVHFSIQKLEMIDGNFYYSRQRIATPYSIRNVNIESSGKSWDSDTTSGKFYFEPAIGTGSITGTFFINFNTLDYHTHFTADKFDLKIFEQYLHAISSYGTFSANLDADLKVKGNFNDVKDVDIKGMLAVNDAHFGKKPGDDYMSFKKLRLKIKEVNPKAEKYNFDSANLWEPFFKYEQYDHLDNYSMMFGANVQNLAADSVSFNPIVEIAKYISTLSEDFLKSDYKVRNLGIYNGRLEYCDYSINERFAMEFNPVTIIGDSLSKSHKLDRLYLKSGIKPYGDLAVTLIVDPKNVSDFNMYYKLEKVPVPLFNPYLITYTSFPLDRGTIEFNGTWDLRGQMLVSQNHLIITDPRVTKRVKKKDSKWIPMPLIMAFIRERGNVIDYEIPVTGSLKNPTFHLHDVVMDMVKNIFIKPVTTPYRMEVKNIETTIEKDQKLQWQMRQTKMTRRQDRFVSKIIDYLKKNPAVAINVYPVVYSDKEKEYILLYEAKKRFYLIEHKMKPSSYTEDDSEKVDKMSSKSPDFVKFMNRAIPDKMMPTLQQKCNALIGENYVNYKFNQLVKDRQKAFIALFNAKGVGSQVKIQSGEFSIPYNGFSYYRINYKSEIPSTLAEAYQDLNILNEEDPRKNYLTERIIADHKP